jgi:opacity protein-like surface antigen
MKRILLALLPVMAASAYADTQSNSGFYLGLGAANVRNDVDKTKWTPAEVFGGYKLNPFVGAELRIGASAESDVKINDYETLYYRVESANSVGKTYLLLGYTNMNINKESFKGLAYGAGVGFVLNDYFNLNFEYKAANVSSDRLDVKLNSVAVTVDYRF